MLKFSGVDDIHAPLGAVEIGRIGEGMVAKDLLDQGFYVFVPIVYYCPCDLVIMKGRQTFRVQVRTSLHHSYRKTSNGTCDVIAKVSLGKGTIRYKPDPQSLVIASDDMILRCSECSAEVEFDGNAVKYWSNGVRHKALCGKCR